MVHGRTGDVYLNDCDLSGIFEHLLLELLELLFRSFSFPSFSSPSSISSSVEIDLRLDARFSLFSRLRFFRVSEVDLRGVEIAELELEACWLGNFFWYCCSSFVLNEILYWTPMSHTPVSHRLWVIIYDSGKFLFTFEWVQIEGMSQLWMRRQKGREPENSKSNQPSSEVDLN